MSFDREKRIGYRPYVYLIFVVAFRCRREKQYVCDRMIACFNTRSKSTSICMNRYTTASEDLPSPIGSKFYFRGSASDGI